MSVAVAREDPRPVRRVESWTSSIVALDRWLKLSKTGDRFTYAHGEQLLDPGLGEHVRRLADEGEVKMRRDRAADGLFDYYVIRDRIRVVTEQRPKAQGPLLDGPTHAVLLKLRAVAREGARCPSDEKLGAALGLTRNQVIWSMRKLRRLGLIRTEVVVAPDQPKFRIVTIVATGDRTAAPKGSVR